MTFASAASLKGSGAADGLDEQLDRQASVMVESQGGPDAAEGIAAFFERRAVAMLV
jgi:hypothetical protein